MKRIAFCGGLLATLLLAGAASAQLDGEQQKCVNTLNKDAVKLAAAQGKANVACLKQATAGKLPSGQTADACLRADAKGKVAALQARIGSDAAALCATNPPGFGLPGGTVAAVVAAVPPDQSLSLLADVFGASLGTGAIPCATDKPACSCQNAVAKGYEKLAATVFKTFLKCKKGALKDGALSAATLEDCVDDDGTADSIAADAKGKIAKRVAKLDDAIAKSCAGVSTARALPGACAGRAGTALADCLAERVACRACLTLNLVDGLAVDCDAFDDGQHNLSCPLETFALKSPAEPADTPGSSGVTAAAYPKLVTQFGGSDVSLNNARFTRFRLSPTATEPDAILILVPGFEGGANDFKILAENLIPRVLAGSGKVLEVWAYDRRSNQLEDTLGLDIAEALGDAQVGLDWLFGGELSLPLSPALAAGPNRRAQFHDAQAETAFIANWTPLTFSRDIDAIVEAARAVAKNGNVFLGGHSAGTGFAARYAATDFNLTGSGPADPGYAKLRGLVLLEGGGGSTGQTFSSDTLDRIEAKFDGGLFGAVRANAGRCVDGTTACTLANEATACAGQVPPKCTLPTTAYAASAILNARILAAVEPPAIQGLSDPDGGQIILQVDQGAPGNNAVAKVPDLSPLALLPQATVYGGIGSFIDDDGLIAGFATFVATSVGATGPVVGPLTTWLDTDEGPFPPTAVPDNGPPPATLPGGVWGQEKEVTRFDRMLTTFYAGHSNFVDWYYPSSGLGVTSVGGVCTSGTCTVGAVGASCSNNANCNEAINLDSTALSIGRGRRDIENLTQAANIDIPVIGFGGSNGLAPVPGRFTALAESLGPCTAPSCSGAPRVVDASTPNPAFPTFGDVAGGFEVHISEGFAHVDVLTAEDDANNNVLAPLAAFIDRNAQ